MSTLRPNNSDSSISMPARPKEARDAIRFELHKHVHIAVRAEAIRQNGTEQGQLADVVSRAKALNFRARNLETVKLQGHWVHCGTEKQPSVDS